MPITVTDGVFVLNSYNLPTVGTPVITATPYSANVAEGSVTGPILATSTSLTLQNL